MIRKIFAFLFVVALGLYGSVFARDLKQEYAHKVTPEEEAQWEQKLKGLTDYIKAPVVEDRAELGRTFYDYATNSVMGRMISRSTNGFHFAFMKINPEGAQRFVTYDYFDNFTGIFFGNQSVTEDRRTGWGRVLTGKNDEAIISLHADPSQLWFDVAEAGYSFTASLDQNPGVFAGMDRSGDNIIFITQQTNNSWNDGAFFYSTDYGATWQSGGFFSMTDLGVTDHGNAERWPQFNPANVPQFSHMVGPADHPDFPNGSIWWVSSSDWGATFDQVLVHYDDKVINTAFGESQYIIENFTQWNAMYTGDGTYHAVFGAVQGVRDTTTSTVIDMWPILYWNPVINQLYWLNDTSSAAPSDSSTMEGLQANRPGNGLGNSYPHLSEGPNGELLAVWQQWEDDGNGGLVLVTPQGGNPIFMTDIYGAYSPDGGFTWSHPFFVAGTPGESDVYPNVPRNFRFNDAGDAIVVDLLYLWDTNPGVSIFATPNSSPSETVWYYEPVEIPLSGLTFRPTITPVGIEDLPNTAVKDFALAQNYPNPFNPSTTIEYRLKKAADVTLTVHNLRGQKVATLVNGRKSAGEHKVEFNAANLASGLYFYTLQSGSVELTRKMLLIK